MGLAWAVPAGYDAVHPVDVARRGWLTKDDVFNTRSLGEVTKELKRRKASVGA